MPTSTTSNREKLPGLRPQIPSIDLGAATNPAEKFQNEVLRPVLKFQHPILQSVFRNHLRKGKDRFFQLSPAEQAQFIQNSLQRDISLRHFLMGLVVGQFTIREHEQFLADEKVIRKRLLKLLEQRLSDTFVGGGTG